MDYSNFLMMKEELSLIAVMVILRTDSLGLTFSS